MQQRFVLGLIILLASCQAPEENVVVINSIWSDLTPRRALEALAGSFEKDNPGYKVQINTFDDFNFKKGLEEWKIADTPPDLITWVAGKRTEDLSPYAANLNHLFSKTPFQDVFLKKFLDPSSVNGSIYFIPQSWYWWAMYYRPSVFKDLGITSTPQSWEQFLELCDLIKSKGLAPLALGVKEDPWTVGGWLDYLDIRTNGGAFHQDFLAGRISFANKQIQGSLKILPELIKAGFLNPDFGEIGYEESAELLFKGKAAMVFLGEFIQDLTPPDLRNDLDFFAFPQWACHKRNGDTAWEDAPLDGYIKMKKSPHPKAADKFLQFIMNAENQKFWAQNLGRVAANKNVDTPDLMTRRGIKHVQSATGVFQFIDRDMPAKFSFPFLDLYISYLTGAKSEDDVFKEMESLRIRSFGLGKP